ncbi:hypothetical protein LOK49_LG12G01820 [Camellia lanceoleosa]|uniref:Uncharacterized protein n=1 Tax=Camellia lanceoleosa TaxID=1840588 RepID=A0ACC0FR48_9ERIC|nr:hypothetical protein LOK49_LG12G01820 [Camellia lanceoleosa]
MKAAKGLFRCTKKKKAAKGRVQTCLDIRTLPQLSLSLSPSLSNHLFHYLAGISRRSRLRTRSFGGGLLRKSRSDIRSVIACERNALLRA